MAHETTYEYRYMYLNYGTTEPMRDGLGGVQISRNIIQNFPARSAKKNFSKST